MSVYKFSKGYSERGAQMGRLEYNRPPKKARSVRLFRVDLIQGYDNGGAYWGSGQQLWCAMAREEQYREFVRADNRRAAMKALNLTITQLISKRSI